MVDSNIPLSVQVPQATQPFQTVSQLYALRDQQNQQQYAPQIREQQLEAAKQNNEAERMKIDAAKRQIDAENTYADLLKKHTVPVTIPTEQPKPAAAAPVSPSAPVAAPRGPIPVTATSDSTSQDNIGFPAGGPSSQAQELSSPPPPAPEVPPSAEEPTEPTPIASEPPAEPNVTPESAEPPAPAAQKTALAPSPLLAAQPQPQTEHVTNYRSLVNDLLSSGNPILIQRGQALQAQMNSEVKANEDALKQRLANAKAKVGLVGATLNDVDEKSDWTQVRRDLIAAGEPDAAIPLHYNEQWVKQKRDASIEHKDFVAATEKALESDPKTTKEWIDVLGTYYGALNSPKEVLAAHDVMLHRHAPPDLVDAVAKAWIANGPAGARKFAMSAKDQQESGGIVDKIPQINGMMTMRWQVLHPGQALPKEFTLGPDATQKDADRADKMLSQTEVAEGTKQTRDQSLDLRRLTMEMINENRKAGAERANQAADDRAEQRGMTQVIGTDANGKSVMVSQARAKELGLSDITKLDSQDVTKAYSARHFLPLAYNNDPANPGVMQLIDGLDKKGKLGPLASRWNEFLAGKFGSGDQDYERLRTRLGLATTLLMNLHVGARGGSYMMEHFNDLANAGKMDAPTLKAGVDEELKYARDRAMLPPDTAKSTKVPAAASAPTPQAAPPAQPSAQPSAAPATPANPWRKPAAESSSAAPTPKSPNGQSVAAPKTEYAVIATIDGKPKRISSRAELDKLPEGTSALVNGTEYVVKNGKLVSVQ